MIERIVNCPNCCSIILTVPYSNDFYFTSCPECKEKCVYLTTKRADEFREMASKIPNVSFDEWIKKCHEENIKIKYI